MQEVPRGTGDACARRARRSRASSGDVLVLSGDVPGLTAELLRGADRDPPRGRARPRPCSFLRAADARSYGRIVRDARRAARPHRRGRRREPGGARDRRGQLRHLRLRVGAALAGARAARAPQRAGRALPDRHDRAARRRRERGRRPPRARPVRGRGGQHARRARRCAAAGLRDRINRAHMLAGVTIVDPASTWIEPDVEIEPDVDDPAVRRARRARPAIATGARDPPHTVAVDAEIGAGATVGPFCYLRPGTVLEADSKAGTFVEIKNSRIGPQLEGAPPLLHRRRRDRRGHEHRRRRDHGELRASARPAEGEDADRQERQDRHPEWVHRPCRGRRRSMDGSRIDDHQGRSRRRACGRARARRRTRRAMRLGTATGELVLPGLDDVETVATVTAAQPGHWIEGGPQKRLMVFAGRSHPELAERDRRAARGRARRGRAEDVRQRRDLQPLRRVDPRLRPLHRPDRLRARSTAT